MNKYDIKGHAEDAEAMQRAIRIMQETAEERIVSILNKRPNKSVKIEHTHGFYPTMIHFNSNREEDREVFDNTGTFEVFKPDEITLFNGEENSKCPCLKCGDKYYYYHEFEDYSYIRLYNVLMNELRWQYNKQNNI